MKKTRICTLIFTISMFLPAVYAQNDVITNDNNIHAFMLIQNPKYHDPVVGTYMVINGDTVYCNFDFALNKDTVTMSGLEYYKEDVKNKRLLLIGYGKVIRRSYPFTCICIYYHVVNFTRVYRTITDIAFDKRRRITGITTE